MELAEEWEGHRQPLLDQIRGAQNERRKRREGAMKKFARVKELRLEQRSMVRDLQERVKAQALELREAIARRAALEAKVAALKGSAAHDEQQGTGRRASVKAMRV